MAMSKKKASDLARGNLDAYFRSRKPPGPLKCEVGDVVAYTRYFLRQIGMGSGTEPEWRLRGVVKSFHKNGRLVTVHWDGDDEPMLVALDHLAKPGRNLRYRD